MRKTSNLILNSNSPLVKTSQLIVIWYGVIAIVLATVDKFRFSFESFVAGVVLLALVALYTLRDLPNVDKKIVRRWVGIPGGLLFLLTIVALFSD